MTKIYNLKTQLQQGQQGEATVRNWLQFQGWSIRPASFTEQHQGIDFWGIRAGHPSISFEIKTDWTAHRTFNAFVELQSDVKAGKLGWLFTSQADTLLYWVPKLDALYWINLEAVRVAYADWKQLYPVRNVYNQGYYATGLLVPLETFETCALRTYHLGPRIPPAA